MKSLLIAIVLLFGFNATAEASDLSKFFRSQRHHSFHQQQRDHYNFHRYQNRRYRYDYYQLRGRYYYPRSGIYYDPFHGDFYYRF